MSKLIQKNKAKRLRATTFAFAVKVGRTKSTHWKKQKKNISNFMCTNNILLVCKNMSEYWLTTLLEISGKIRIQDKVYTRTKLQF